MLKAASIPYGAVIEARLKLKVPDPDTILPVPLSQYCNRTSRNQLLPAQKAAYPVIMAGAETVLSAPTGSGKTLSFLLPAAAKLLTIPPAAAGAPHGLVVVPTRDLAQQVGEEAEALLSACGRRAVTVIGGKSTRLDTQKLAMPAELIIGTPGRLAQLVKAGQLHLENSSLLIADEADQLLDPSFWLHLKLLLRKMPATAQHVWVSATVSPALQKAATSVAAGRAVEVISAAGVPAPAKQQRSSEQNIDFVTWWCANDAAKLPVLVHLLGKPRKTRSNQRGNQPTWFGRKTIVFVETRNRVHSVARLLKERYGLEVVMLHGQLGVTTRNEAIRALERGPVTLIATDAAARGLDITGCDQVIHLDSPQDVAQLIHRSGRTGRAGKRGRAHVIATNSEKGQLRKLFTRAEISAQEHTWKS